ncbi:hypothetical protein ONS95_012457 [Cadophora gregata]|uniref:uncharacterized protein n=1 Tax=Cadophora gregata TaxID=51156 RepID=UPI0026DB963B|nr:uncharacterized protein ONS95_012457 [Cadophora gregata]KAK0118151.1 hypothetical protein ONS95_012457 [Cadophora gregata]KAK0123223.1 hypothetical protein ONS96_010223 [Cadophora gregata f. sp. sojae]
MTSLNISQDDLASFHAAHFSVTSVDHFSEHFLGPVEEEYYEEKAVDDGLGYYKDGVKRTLTDEQIAIFRHSEIEALLREQRHAVEEKEHQKTYTTGETVSDEGAVESKYPVPDDVEDGELEEESPGSSVSTPTASKPHTHMTKKEKKTQRAKQMGFFKQNVKPDLRKRTWDKVDTGLGSLDYDEDERAPKRATANPAQRRRISYDD